MPARRMPDGTTTYYPELQPDGTWKSGAGWETDPSSWDVGPNGEGGLAATKHNWLLDKGVPLAVGGIFGYGAFGPGGYAQLGGGAAPAASASTSGAVTSAGTPMADFLASAPAYGATDAGVIGGTTMGASAGAGGTASTLAKLFGKNGSIDSTSLILGALSLLNNPNRKSFSGAGVADPKAALQHSLQSIYDFQDELKNTPPTTVQRREYDAPAPVSIPGLGFQIGGGLAHNDPALDPQQPVKLRTPNV